MDPPRLAYAANRKCGLKCLERLLDTGWRPSALLVASGSNAECADAMVELLPDVPVLRGKEFRAPEGVQRLADLELDYLVSVLFPYLIPPEVLSLSSQGTLNLHPAHLPYNRGWHTPSWAILDGTPYGVTLHWVDEGLDTGDVGLRRELDLQPDDTAHLLYQRALRLAEEVFQEAIPLLRTGQLQRVPQEEGGTSHRKKDLRSVQELDLSEQMQVGAVIRRLRALTTNRWDEAARFSEDGVSYRIRVEIEPISD